MKIAIASKVFATETPSFTVLSIPSLKRAVPALSASRAAGKAIERRRMQVFYLSFALTFVQDMFAVRTQ
jgi:hypothetical protein